MHRALLWMVVISLSAAACGAPPPAASGTGGDLSVRRPVVIVHGWQILCGTEDADTWKTWIGEAHARGYGDDDVVVFSYNTCAANAGSIERLGRAVDATLEETGADRVNVIAHSMGSLIARSCARFGACEGKVDKFLSLAGANHGTVWANACELAFWSRSTCDMRPDGAFLARLNAGDETWGDVEYTTMISWCDLTIVPFTSAGLHGARNIVTNRCLTHTDWRSDTTAARWTLDWFDGTGPGTRQPPGPHRGSAVEASEDAASGSLRGSAPLSSSAA